MKSLKVIALYICVCLAIVNSIKCDEDDCLLQYDGESSMSNIDDMNKEIYEDEISSLPDSGLVLEHEMIYEQSDQPVSGERFIAVRVDKVGAAENLNPNLVGLSNMAIQFLPKDYKLIEVIEATREIISGVRYELLISARDENDSDIICRLVVSEITWKLTAWGDKQRILDFSNCTSNATVDDNVPKSNDFNFNPLFVTKTNSINEDDLKLIEAQIIRHKNAEKNVSKPKTSEVSDFDLSNLEAMIIPSKSSLVKSKSQSKAEKEPNMNVVMESQFDTNTQSVSKANVVTTDNQSTDEQTAKSETLAETQIINDSIVSNCVTEKIDEKSHEILPEELNTSEVAHRTSSQVQVTDLNNTESTKQEDTFKELKLEETTTETEEFDLNVLSSPLPYILKKTLESPKSEKEPQTYVENRDFENNTEITSKTTILQVNEITESQAQSVEGLTSSHDNIMTDDKGTTTQAIQDSPSDNSQFQPQIEGINLQMEDSNPILTDRTIVIFDKMKEDVKEFNEYAAESHKNSEVFSDSLSSDRTKRHTNTKMGFLEHITNEALKQLDYVDSDNFKRIALDILRVKKIDQEDGATYVIKVKTANSNCPEDSDELHETCLENIIKDTTKVCFIEVKSISDVNKVTKSACAPERRERDESDPTENYYIEKLLSAGLAELSKKPDSSKYGIHRVISYSKQIVAGTLYTVNAELSLPNNEIQRCEIMLLAREWIKPDPDVIELNCGKGDELTRRKRSLLYDSLMENRYTTEHEKNVSNMFNQFKISFNKNYESAMEHATRLRIFKHNLYIIDELNRNEQGTATYGITEFADYTPHEYKQRTGLLRRTVDNEIPHPMAEIPNIQLPENFDWRDKGAVSEVKNQASCGSCWAFSVTGNIEGLYAIKNHNLEEFSEQELVDCDTLDQGCNGGLPDNAYKAIEQLGGLETESQYPYSARKEKCHFDLSLTRVKISGAVDLPQNETAMAQYLVQNGPISIGINANAMQFYRGGISHPPRILCRHSSIDHGVLIVGYGVANYPVFNKTLPYWIVKNSWGPKWGESGYYRVFRGANTCGLTSMVTSAILE